MLLVLIVLSSLVLLWPAPILANMGLPMVALYLPPAWLALLPIILIESAYGVWRFKVPMGRAFVAQAAANSVSTLIGIPATWIILALGEMFVLEWAVSVAPEPLLIIVSPIVGAAWLGPGAEQTAWMVPLAVALLTVPFYAMSVVFEYLVVAQFFRHLPRQVIRRWTVRANAISYAFLVVTPNATMGRSTPASMDPRPTTCCTVRSQPDRQKAGFQSSGGQPGVAPESAWTCRGTPRR